YIAITQHANFTTPVTPSAHIKFGILAPAPPVNPNVVERPLETADPVDNQVMPAGPLVITNPDFSPITLVPVPGDNSKFGINFNPGPTKSRTGTITLALDSGS